MTMQACDQLIRSQALDEDTVSLGAGEDQPQSRVNGHGQHRTPTMADGMYERHGVRLG